MGNGCDIKQNQVIFNGFKWWKTNLFSCYEYQPSLFPFWIVNLLGKDLYEKQTFLKFIYNKPCWYEWLVVVPGEWPPIFNPALHFQCWVSLCNLTLHIYCYSKCVSICRVVLWIVMMLHFENFKLGWSWVVAHRVLVTHWSFFHYMTLVYQGPTLKALFNNVFTLKNLSCMALHAISVFDNV